MEKKKIAILGSTGSIGKNLIKIIDNDKQKFTIILLSANKDYKSLLKQAKKYKVKNLIITNKNSYKLLKKETIRKNINIYNDFKNLNKIFKKRIDYTMSAISGLEGLIPTLNIIKYTKEIAIANKESIICGWNLISNQLKLFKTKFIPVDSEHFSIWYGLYNNKNSIEKIYLTASGGPFNNLPLNKFKNINIRQALKHPNWKMGKKISIDSATMMNKVFEIIEAKKIFDINYKRLNILIHPKSYVHAIIKFNNGLIKLIAHETDMKIPIYNSLFLSDKKSKKIFHSKNIDIDKLNNLNFEKINNKRFQSTKILNYLPNNNSLFETILVTANDELVKNFLQKKIKFIEIVSKLLLFIRKPEFKKYKKKSPKNVDEIIKLGNYVRLKINSKSI